MTMLCSMRGLRTCWLPISHAGWLPALLWDRPGTASCLPCAGLTGAMSSGDGAPEWLNCRWSRSVELGRTLWRLGDKERALAELEAALALDVEDINAHLQKARLIDLHPAALGVVSSRPVSHPLLLPSHACTCKQRKHCRDSMRSRICCPTGMAGGRGDPGEGHAAQPEPPGPHAAAAGRTCRRAAASRRAALALAPAAWPIWPASTQQCGPHASQCCHRDRRQHSRWRAGKRLRLAAALGKTGPGDAGGCRWSKFRCRLSRESAVGSRCYMLSTVRIVQSRGSTVSSPGELLCDYV